MNIILRDLDFDAFDLQLIVYHQTGININLEPKKRGSITFQDIVDGRVLKSEKRTVEEYSQRLRLSGLTITLLNIFPFPYSKELKKTEVFRPMDRGLFWLRVFLKSEIDFRFEINPAESQFLRSVSPPLFDKIKSLTQPT